MRARKNGTSEVFSQPPTRKASKSAHVLQARMEPRITRSNRPRQASSTTNDTSTVSQSPVVPVAAQSAPTMSSLDAAQPVVPSVPVMAPRIHQQPTEQPAGSVRQEILLGTGERGQEMWGYSESDTGECNGDDGAVSDPSPADDEDTSSDDTYQEEPSTRFNEAPAAAASVSTTHTSTAMASTVPGRSTTGKRKGRKPTPIPTSIPVADEGKYSFYIGSSSLMPFSFQCALVGRIRRCKASLKYHRSK
jgi:hypothetical protein